MEYNEFNVFRNLSLSEDGHTSLLKKLLHPAGKHNQGDLFLKIFVEKVLCSDYVSDLRIRLNVKAGNKGFIDLLLDTKDKTVIYIIENKVKHAKDRPNQLYRYWRNHILKAEKKNIRGDFRLFYLTLDGESPAPDSIGKPIVGKHISKYDGLPEELPMKVNLISYKKDIKRWLQACLNKIENTKGNQRLILTLEQYVEWIDYAH